MILTPDEIKTMRAGAILNGARMFWELVDEVCTEYNIPRKAMLAESRGTAAVAEARQFVCLCASRRGMASGQIGRFLGRDNSTVLHAIRQAEIKEDDRRATLMVHAFKSGELP